MPQLGINTSGVSNTPRQAPAKSKLYNLLADLWDALPVGPLPKRLNITGISIPTSKPVATLIREKSHLMWVWTACPFAYR